MKISDNGIKFIASFEGCVLHAYWDRTGKVWTIGFGHTKGVKQGDLITKEQAYRFLREDCNTAEKNVNKFEAHYQWNQNEYDAMVSFAFNVGSINQLTANGTRTKAQIAKNITAYNKSGGVFLAGLARRREAEKTLFLKPVENKTDKIIPQSKIINGWVKDYNGWRYYQNNGATYVKNDWHMDSTEQWSFFNSDGYAIHDTLLSVDNSHKYYFGSDCYMETNRWVIIDGHYYYFDNNGLMVFNCYVKAKDINRGSTYYYVNAMGVYMSNADFYGDAETLKPQYRVIE